MTGALTPERIAVLRRRIRWIVAFTIGYNVIEAVIALAAGGAASSAALIGFGLDSIVEVLSAAAVAWQFAAPDPETREKAALRVIAFSFFGLAIYVGIEAVLGLSGWRQPEHSPVGIGLAIASLIVMPGASLIERRTGRELGSASAIADSKQTLICTYLSAALLAGLLLNQLLGWTWADSLAALVIAGFAVKEGLEAWRGDSCTVPVSALTGEIEVDEDHHQHDHHDHDHQLDEAARPAERSRRPLVLKQIPEGCTLAEDEGERRLHAWRAFDGDYLLETERTDGRLTIHYAKVDDSMQRLRQLVDAESSCCSFVRWDVDATHHDLRLIVTGAPDSLAAITAY